LLDKPRWLIFTKSDQLTADDAAERVSAALTELAWDGPHFLISAVARQGLEPLLWATAEQLQANRAAAAEQAESAAD
jgi:GTP-binding protein